MSEAKAQQAWIRVLQQNSFYHVRVGAHGVRESKLKGLESLGVGDLKCRTIALEKQSWCSRGWSLTKFQVGAWQLIPTIYILYLFYCKYLLIKASILVFHLLL